MTHRAFCEDLSSGTAVLNDSEAHHLQHVLRIAPGECICLFDGKGYEATATVAEISRHEVTCEIHSLRKIPIPCRPKVTVAASPPKGERLKWMVEKLTEIGTDRLILLQTVRTIVVPGETRIDKLHSCVIAACKQCRRSRLMDVSPPVSFQSLLAEPSIVNEHTTLLIAHPGDSSQPLASALNGIPSGNSRVVLIGPEGGFTDDEVSMAARSGSIPIAWPENILRIETAAIVITAALLSRED